MDLVVDLLAVVVVPLPVDGEGPADLQRHGGDNLCASYGAGAVHSISLSRRRLLGARP
jgi:hypothetical protein